MAEPTPTLVVVEDEREMRRFLRAALSSQGYRVVEAETAREAVGAIASHNPDAVVLDLGLPDGDGLGVLREVRAWSQVPIVVVSARGRESDKVQALDDGADDYLTKPFGVGELLARLRVALRHASRRKGQDEPLLTIGSLHIDIARHEVRCEGREIHLTPLEFKLLALLAHNAGKVLTHRQIQREVWGPKVATTSHHVRVHMAELRKKIEANPATPRWLLTEPGVGYRLRDEA